MTIAEEKGDFSRRLKEAMRKARPDGAQMAVRRGASHAGQAAHAGAVAGGVSALVALRRARAGAYDRKAGYRDLRGGFGLAGKKIRLAQRAAPEDGPRNYTRPAATRRQAVAGDVRVAPRVNSGARTRSPPAGC